MINLSLEQARVALECIQNDVEMSEFGNCEFTDIETLRFYLQRAETLQHLQRAIANVTAQDGGAI